MVAPLLTELPYTLCTLFQSILKQLPLGIVNIPLHMAMHLCNANLICILRILP